MIVHASQPVTLVGGGELDPKDLAISLNLAPVLVAADGGADAVLAAGLSPVAVIGDMDSLSPAARAAFAPVLQEIAEQETTDFEKCLTHIRAPMVLALGFLGGRADHSFAALNILARLAAPVVLMGAQDVLCLLTGEGVSLDLPKGTRLSLLPMGLARVWSAGLRWPLAGEPMSPAGFLSLSNEVSGPVRLRAEGAVFLVLPKDQLPALWQAFY